ncbi:MAG: M48 family metallopeptidase, partial [Planctomycetes bacterium]|nr:M48 family metallopeptidase [Planctomycetota bacterium]
MDFFSEQDRARRRGNYLVVLFIAAVVTIVLSIYLVCMAILTHSNRGGMVWWDPQVFLLVTGGTLAVITLGSLGRILSLGSGGASVAEMLGGQLISRDGDERRVLNVVEEMALASGMSVPPVYILNEEGINAFAAGYRKEHAVIGVTRGAIKQLSRDELQGVIAHEFSHILHGDMRLNIRLMGLLYGILMISVIGSIMMRAFYFSGGGRRRSSEKNDGAAVIMAIAAAGLAMYVLGYVGVFFGNLIKAAVSRQREFLADASAVQYTRNPDGIGGALKRIAGFHTRISHTGASEASHLFFGPISSFSNLFATHPPIEERIQRLDPAFKAEKAPSPLDSTSNAEEGAAGFSAGVKPLEAHGRQQVLDSVGDPDRKHLNHSRELLQGLGESLREELRHP